MDTALVTKNLRKVYKLGRGKKEKVALSDLNIEVSAGVIFGFLGPNGAGKTTTIKLLLNFIRPTSGSAEIFGGSIEDHSTRRRIGYLPEQPYFHKFLKPIEIVTMHAGLAGVSKSECIERAKSAIERAGISEYSNIPVSKLSKGLTQRVGIAQALVGDPDLLILDEPTSGLDPIGRRHTRDLLLSLRDMGKTIFLSSHLLSEIENICDIVAVLRSGKIVAHGKPDDVRKSESLVRIQTNMLDGDQMQALQFTKVGIEVQNNCAKLTCDMNNIHEVMRLIESLNIKIISIDTERESLEEAFLRLAA